MKKWTEHQGRIQEVVLHRDPATGNFTGFVDAFGYAGVMWILGGLEKLPEGFCDTREEALCYYRSTRRKKIEAIDELLSWLKIAARPVAWNASLKEWVNVQVAQQEEYKRCLQNQLDNLEQGVLAS